MSKGGEEQVTAMLRDLPYFGRYAWVTIKESLGLPRHGDRTFYIDRLVRALRAGALGRNYAIMATGKNDGAGSQAQAAMSAICFAEAFGLEYIHRPFTSIEHAETDMSDWVRRWEEYFNLGFGARQLSQCAGPVVPLDQLLMAPDKWPDTAIISAPHYLHFCNQDHDAWEGGLPLLHGKYRQNKGPRKREAFTVAVHVRRGDVSRENRKVARNFTPMATFTTTLASVVEIVSSKVSGARIRLFSQGDPEIFADFARFGCELCLDEPAIATHAQLVKADVLIMSKGAFSYTAALLNEGITFYDPQKYRPLKGWIVRAPDGAFDKGEFSRRLDALLARSEP